MSWIVFNKVWFRFRIFVNDLIYIHNNFQFIVSILEKLEKYYDV